MTAEQVVEMLSNNPTLLARVAKELRVSSQLVYTCVNCKRQPPSWEGLCLSCLEEGER